MKRFTGLDTKVIEVPDHLGFEAKLSLDKHAGKRPFMFYDADIFCLRGWDPMSMMGGPSVKGVHDHAVWNCHAFPHTDCTQHGLNASSYLNSGLLFFDGREDAHKELFKLARKSWRDQKAGRKEYADTTDQAHISFAIQALGIPVTLLPMQFNTYLFGIQHGQFPYIPRDIINLHGAGIPAKHKFSQLKTQASVFGKPVYPMHEEAIHWEWNRQYSFR